MISKELRQLASMNDDFAVCLRPHLPREAARLLSCTHSLLHEGGARASYCYSPYCGLCNRLSAEEESRVLRTRLHDVRQAYPTGKFLHMTVTAPDCLPCDIGEAREGLQHAWLGFTRSEPFAHCLGWYYAVEVVGSGVRPELENVHMHAVVAMRPGYSGRNYLSRESWKLVWQDHAEAGCSRGFDVRGHTKLDRLGSYVVKHSAAAHMEPLRIGIEDPARAIERRLQMQGRNRYHHSGALSPNLQERYGEFDQADYAKVRRADRKVGRDASRERFHGRLG
jgi:hypothetical protein